MVERQILINQKQVESRRIYHFTKRVFDIVTSTLGLIVLSPVMAVIAYKVKREDGGPIIYDELSNQVQRFLKKYLIWGFII